MTLQTYPIAVQGNSSESEDEWVKSRQINLLFDNSLSANIAVMVASILFVVVISDTPEGYMARLWAVTMLLFASLRLILWWRFRSQADSASHDEWARRYTLATLLVGINWSMLGVFLLMSDGLLVQGMVFIIMLGAIAASATVLSSLLPAFYAYILPMAITGTFAFLFKGDFISLMLGIGLLVYILMIISTARNANHNFTRFLRLQYENQQLITQLSNEVSERKQAQKSLKDYSDQLEKKVEARTRQLVRINRSLENEITERRRAEENLQHLAHHDALTNLPNRLLLDARLQLAMERARRHNGGLAILFMDLDGFKHVNDSMGHQAGDELLCKVAERLQQCIRQVDTLARLGGDEFVVVMGEVTDRHAVETLASKLMDTLQQPFIINQQSLYIGTSIGISLYPAHGETAEQLLTHADAAMYRAKDEGRHNFQFYESDMSEVAYDRVMLEAALRKALDERQFLLYYQPQIDLENGRLCGVEALIRWRHPDLGILTPAHFIAAAEDSGLIVAIGEWVLQQACRQMAQWKQAGFDLDYMAINLAGQQIHDSNLLSLVEQIIHVTGCDASWLELEITETFIMQRIGQAIETLDKLKQLGVSMAIDDFGTGYSSLSYLRRLPVDKLKIDRSFICDITTDANDAAIVQAIIALGKTLNLEVIAEGIETRQQEDFLKQQGCDQGQGYYIGYPQPAEEMTRVLRQGLQKA